MARTALVWSRQKPNQKRQLVICTAATISFCVALMLITRTSEPRVTLEDSPEVLARIHANSGRPVLLLWTAVWGEAVQEDLDHLVCFGSKISCRVTGDRALIAEASALVFHARDVSFTDLPEKKFAGQPWILWNQEAPHNTPFSVYTEGNDLFDLELSYRTSADIVAPYGFLSERHNVKVGPKDETELRTLFYSQTGAVWLVSDCATQSRREDYVKELAQYFPVEVYGDCGDRQCPRNSNDSCMNDFSRRFMFYLAFENSICPDYVTEKLYRSLQYPIIPVVFSGRRDPHLDSLQAYVDAGIFTPEALARKLDSISRNLTEYEGYFRWKRSFTAHSQEHPICLVCQAIKAQSTGVSFNRQRNDSLVDRLRQDGCKRWDRFSRKLEPVQL